MNTFVGQLEHATALLGVLHACYGLGCAISPIVATRMVAAGLGWNSYYYVLLGWAILNTIVLGITYHPKFMKEKERDVQMTEIATIPEIKTNGTTTIAATTINDNVTPTPRRQKGPLQIVMTNRFCWLVALFLLLYLGLEISTGGWVVSYMIEVHPHKKLINMRYDTEHLIQCPM